LLRDELSRLKKLKTDSMIKTDNSTEEMTIEMDRTTVQRRILEVSNYLPTYDPDYLDTNPSYDVTTDIQCWSKDCSSEILNNHEAYANCNVTLATTWNAIGVKNMERFVSIGKRFPNITVLHESYLQRALDAFNNATQIDPTCSRAFVNLALVYMQYDNPDLALNAMNQAIKDDPSVRNLAILGFVQDFAGDRSAAERSWRDAMAIDPYIGERKYFGIMVVEDTIPEHHTLKPLIREYSPEFEIPMARDLLTFIEFSPVSISNYATIPPGTQEFFIKNRYVVLRDIVPPFVLRSVAYCYQKLREEKKLFEDNKRHSSYNDRAGRTLHYQMVDLVRRVILHNLHPSYSFFGSYVGGSKLLPHSDKPQCEFTVSLTLDQYPDEEVYPWALSIGRKPKFDRDDTFEGNGSETMPPENEIVDTYLYPGDCLLFMGRHLIHFRRTTLPENQYMDHIFLHNVRDKWNGGSYD